jgi:hypothetical protein
MRARTDLAPLGWDERRHPEDLGRGDILRAAEERRSLRRQALVGIGVDVESPREAPASAPSPPQKGMIAQRIVGVLDQDGTGHAPPKRGIVVAGLGATGPELVRDIEMGRGLCPGQAQEAMDQGRGGRMSLARRSNRLIRATGNRCEAVRTRIVFRSSSNTAGTTHPQTDWREWRKMSLGKSKFLAVPMADVAALDRIA